MQAAVPAAALDWFQRTNLHCRNLPYDFWHQRAVLAEREASSLREKLKLEAHDPSLPLPMSMEESAVEQSPPSPPPPPPSPPPTTSSTPHSPTPSTDAASFERDLAAKDKEIGHLVSEVQRLQASLEQLQERSGKELGRLEEELQQKSLRLQELEKQVQEQGDYHLLKRELSILKSVEFPSTGLMGRPLESLLLEKSKALQSENTALKLAKADLAERLSKMEEEGREREERLSFQESLIARLEADLAAVRGLSLLYRGEGEGEEATSAVVAEAVRDIYTTSVHMDSYKSESSAAETLLPIVSAQRERFKKRNEELESQAEQHRHQLSALQDEINILKEDNLQLYQKIRFLHSYQPEGRADPIGAESRYSSQYEARLDPFSSFRGREHQRRYATLSPFEKLTLSMGRMVMGNRMARTLACVYMFALHALVFVVCYKLAYTQDCHDKAAFECAKRYQDHMREVHQKDV